jgi:hypothetical protein
MKQGYTHISIVLDRSGSMGSVKADTIGGFNAFLVQQKSAPGEATLTLAQFDNEYDLLADFAPIGSVQPLTDQTYVPRGSTALLDAIGRTINQTGKRLAALLDAERPAHVIVVIMTDGEENSSNAFSRSQIFSMISHQREAYAWEFVFIGANQDAIGTGASLGIAGGNSIAYAATSAGQSDIVGKMSANVLRRREKSMQAPAAAPYPSVADEPFFTEEDRTTRPDMPADSM